MTRELWNRRRVTARASLVLTAFVLVSLLSVGARNGLVVVGWFLFSAVMWAVAEVTTARGARPEEFPPAPTTTPPPAPAAEHASVLESVGTPDTQGAPPTVGTPSRPKELLPS